jgi:hypothetical protein
MYLIHPIYCRSALMKRWRSLGDWLRIDSREGIPGVGRTVDGTSDLGMESHGFGQAGLRNV